MISFLVCVLLTVSAILHAIYALQGKEFLSAYWFMLGALTTAGLYAVCIGEAIVGLFAFLPLVATLLCTWIRKSEFENETQI